MTINVSGSGKRKRELVVEAAYFYKQLLMPRMRKLHLDINLSPSLFEKNGDLGDCVWEDKHRYAREFTINLDSKDSVKMIQTLAHEMVHVKQWARGEMYDVYHDDDGSPQKTQWKSKAVSLSKVHYHDWPWEKQAWKLEEKLYEQWEVHLKTKTI